MAESVDRGPNEVEFAYKLIRNLAGSFPSKEKAESVIESVRIALPTLLPGVDESVVNQAESLYWLHNDVTVLESVSVTDKELEPWLEGAKAGIDAYYWTRYSEYLLQGDEDSTGLPEQVVNRIGRDADKILGLCGNPAVETAWDRRGMVLGAVQSGKTSSYSAVVTKAADAGYRIVVIIAGVQNILRNQTQERIDKAFVGKESVLTGAGGYVGVGAIDRTRIPTSYTNRLKDFNQGTSMVQNRIENHTEPIVFVIKKNVSTLKSLNRWLRSNGLRHGSMHIDEPLLLIDDEADNASINIGHRKDEVSAINGQIRKLLGMFSRSTYIGYTATPFANIFIDPDAYDAGYEDDLFPRSFIVSLDPPSNYVGPDEIFLSRPEAYLREIRDNDGIIPESHRTTLDVEALPASLLRAMRQYILAGAIRKLRGQGSKHHSMLINVSPWTAVQKAVAALVQAELDRLTKSLASYCMLPVETALRESSIREMHDLWMAEYCDAGFSWDEVQHELGLVASHTQVLEINWSSTDALDYRKYPEGRSVIAVGGYALSRGLTLEGLTISYYLRNAKAYDTILQMGRWFGYRPNYGDLCRVYMSPRSIGFFGHIAESVNELRYELTKLEQAGATPMEYGLRVREHPDALAITTPQRIGYQQSVTVRASLANRLVETYKIGRSPSAYKHNLDSVLALVSELKAVDITIAESPGAPSHGVGPIAVGVSSNTILNFISSVDSQGLPWRASPDFLTAWIEHENQFGKLTEWDVVFVSSSKGKIDCSLGFEVGLQQRTVGSSSDDDVLFIGEKQRIASRGSERAGLSDEQVADITNESEPGSNIPDLRYRAKRKRPLLLIHLLELLARDEPDAKVELMDHELDRAVVAWGFSFPDSSSEAQSLEYSLNRRAVEEMENEYAVEEEYYGDEVVADLYE